MASWTVLPKPDTTRLGSLLIATTVVLGGWLLTSATGTTRPALAAGIAGGLLAAIVLFQNTGTPMGTIVATLLLPVPSIIGLAAVGLPLRELVPLAIEGEPFVRQLIGQLGVIIAVGIAAFGVVATFDTGVGKGAVAKLFGTTVRALFGICVPLAGLLILQLDALTVIPISVPGIDGSTLTTFVYQPSEFVFVLTSFWLLVIVQIITVKLLVAVAPIVELSPQTNQEFNRRFLSRTHSMLNTALVLALGLAFVSILLAFGGADLRALLARFPVVFDLLVAPSLRRGLVSGIALVMLGAVLLGGLQFVAGRVTNTVSRLVPSVLAGGSAVVVAIVGSPVVPRAASRIPETPVVPVDQIVTVLTPPGVILAGVTIAVALLTGVLAVIVIAGVFKYIPRRTAGSAIASAGFGFGAITAGIGGSEMLVIFAAVAISILIWNTGERSVTTRAELGPASSIQLEAVHLFSALGLAVGGVGLAWGLYTNALGQLAVSGGTLVGVLASTVGVLLVVVAIRG
ncbi:hypothetical protein EKH57_16020 [Halorubrum sp. BOL3-1]|uniref:hypothetical protein n=1 Tax=Halorubrum sp. BOL3-1 TaxID=2497325 RepID=UPI001004FCA3|nr:hypothetical protein [Halorubrum sp. BOL3-1]QAU14080.1 hypothetical protein EKH57_16020 [Halorubrum sp. BOL3-1]